MTWSQLNNGRALELLDPEPGSWTIEAVAHSLCGINRYTSHTRNPTYSVAQHSVLVSRLLERWGESRSVQRCGLVHDVAEAVMGDLSSQWKHCTEMGILFQYHEEKHLRVILADIGIPWSEFVDAEQVVKKADRVMLATERRDLMGPCERSWELKDEPDGERVRIWIWQRAKQEFLDRWYALGTEEVQD